MKRLAILAVLAGCHFHSGSNAPGISDVENPPEDRSAARVEPVDPGEEMVAVNPGVLVGGGGRAAEPNGFGEAGLEVSVVRGTNPTSHREDNFFTYPLSGQGAAFGWSAVQFDEDGAEVGPIYGEAYAFRLPWAAGGGWSWSPSTNDHGPQLFASVASLYLRGRYLFDAGAEVTLGFQVKLPLVWVWSR